MEHPGTEAGRELGKLRRLARFVCPYCGEEFTARATVRDSEHSTGLRFCRPTHRSAWHNRQRRAAAKAARRDDERPAG